MHGEKRYHEFQRTLRFLLRKNCSKILLKRLISMKTPCYFCFNEIFISRSLPIQIVLVIDVECNISYWLNLLGAAGLMAINR